MSGLSFSQLPCPDDDREDFSYREDLLAGSAGKSSRTGKSSGSWRGDIAEVVAVAERGGSSQTAKNARLLRDALC